MTNHRDDLTEEDLILYHYGESPDAEAIRERLAASPEASRRYEELERLLALADDWTPPEPPEGFAEDVWRRLQPRLSAAPEKRRTVVPAAHRFGQKARRWLLPAAAAALLVVAGYLAGRLASGPVPVPTSAQERSAEALTADARQRLLAETLAEHLERSQRLFTELANRPAGEPDQLESDRVAARELLSANRLYRAAAERGGRGGMAALLDEMEPVLLELVHLPAEPSPEDLAFLRERIEARGLLFKTRVASELLTRSLQSESTSNSRPTV